MVGVVGDDDRIDQAADHGEELLRLVAARDRLAQHADAAAVGFDDLGMEDDRRQRLMLRQRRLRRLEIGLAGVEGLAHFAQIDAGGDGVHQVADLRLQLLDALFDHESR
ncbi:MAG: hypothetical protein WBL20_07765 [Sphingobium sp.]|uniref:hypothetical protein n=1 Tax=Sphingobium sp. TaxID=1912891 RepID=UPI003BB0407D